VEPNSTGGQGSRRAIVPSDDDDDDTENKCSLIGGGILNFLSSSL
jgi:hypothetical protein